MRTSGEPPTGSGRFERMASGLPRDASIPLAERAGRYDLALEGLEQARETRPSDPRVLWAQDRIYRLAGRTESHLGKVRITSRKRPQRTIADCFPPCTGTSLTCTPPTGLPVLLRSPSCVHATVNAPAVPTGARVARFPVAGSLPHYPFRGLINVHRPL